MKVTDYLANLYGKHIVITGANGFLGNNAAKKILEHTGTRLTTLSRPGSENRKIKKLQKEYPGRVSVFPCDTATIRFKNKNTLDSLKRVLDGAYALLHYAGVPNLGIRKDVEDLVYKVNTKGTENIINIIRETQTPPLFIGIGSLFETGIVHDVIYEDSRHGDSFRNPYEKSKWMAANLVRDLYEANKLEGYWFRPSIITGESTTGVGSENGNLRGPAIYAAVAAMRKVHTLQYALNSSVALPFSHVDHVTSAILSVIADKKAPNGTCFHLISERQVQMEEMVRLTAIIVNAKRAKNPQLWGGTEKFTMQYDMHNGIKKPEELMMYAGIDSPVISYQIDNTNSRRYLPRELLEPPIDIYVCLQHVFTQFEKKRKQFNHEETYRIK